MLFARPMKKRTRQILLGAGTVICLYPRSPKEVVTGHVKLLRDRMNAVLERTAGEGLSRDAGKLLNDMEIIQTEARHVYEQEIQKEEVFG